MAAAPSQGKLYVFGGCGSAGRLSDLWCFHTNSSTWQQLASSDAIHPRGGSVLVAAADGLQLFLLGGFNPSVPSGAELTDCHVFDTAANTWSCHEACKNPTPAAAAAAGEGEGVGKDSLAMELGRSVFGAVLHSSGKAGGSGCGECEHSEHVVTFGGEVAPSDRGHAGEEGHTGGGV
jgi:N-acetylneuraminic acid mutarotase